MQLPVVVGVKAARLEIRCLALIDGHTMSKMLTEQSMGCNSPDDELLSIKNEGGELCRLLSLEGLVLYASLEFK